MSIDLFLSIFLHVASIHLPVMYNVPSTQASQSSASKGLKESDRLW